MSIPPEPPPPAPTPGTFVVRVARRALMGQVALHGEATIPLHPGQVLLSPDDDTRLVVKGIEFLHYTDNVRLLLNPWLLVETARPPLDFEGRSFLITEGDAAGRE